MEWAGFVCCIQLLGTVYTLHICNSCSLLWEKGSFHIMKWERNTHVHVLCWPPCNIQSKSYAEFRQTMPSGWNRKRPALRAARNGHRHDCSCAALKTHAFMGVRNLSTVSSVYDRLGFPAPKDFTVKHPLQKLLNLNQRWDSTTTLKYIASDVCYLSKCWAQLWTNIDNGSKPSNFGYMAPEALLEAPVHPGGHHLLTWTNYFLMTLNLKGMFVVDTTLVANTKKNYNIEWYFKWPFFHTKYCNLRRITGWVKDVLRQKKGSSCKNLITERAV